MNYTIEQQIKIRQKSLEQHPYYLYNQSERKGLRVTWRAFVTRFVRRTAREAIVAAESKRRTPS
ncbi:hypothetical protein JZ785_12985 [Alicyclobacillus curvatus]|nr:hypothetical protein JZ785_12985 [Alicyclobacillus curvatus]